jgi:hypothetical protein
MGQSLCIQTTLLRSVSFLFALFLLAIPRRELTDASSFQTGCYYFVVLGYALLSVVRVQKVSQSRLLTGLLFCSAAIPFVFVIARFIVSAVSADLAGMDIYSWTGLLVILILWALLPFAVIVEFKGRKKK